jgi:hypothetical protein
MRIRYKEDPREWRKSVWLTTLGLALVGSAVIWRSGLPAAAWLGWLGVLGLVAVVAAMRAAWFRGYYRLSLRLGVALSHVFARIFLSVFFLLILTPLGFLLRLSGKDLLLLRRPNRESYWTETRPAGPLDRLF